MRITPKHCLSIILTAAVVVSSALFQQVDAAYTPPTTTLKVGLYYGSTALAAANLQNYTGCGSGYQFGILDQNRQFVAIGASTTETKISMLRDKNMVFDSSSNNYAAGSTGDIVVGCYHIQLNTPYSSYAEAQVAISAYTSSFVKYASGTFYGCIGSYITAEAAAAALSSKGISNGAVTSGSSATVTVVKTGTATVLFEFDYGTSNWLVVMPKNDSGTKSQTWFKGYRYYGGFQYARFNGGDLTVINLVNLEDYTKGVIPYEMSNSWPIEALKAQAVCARTYVIENLNGHTGFDVCTTDEDQVYFGVGQANATTDSAVDQTAGKFLMYSGSPCSTAVYSSSDGGATENSENVWVTAIPYLKGIGDPYEADIASTVYDYNWTLTYSPEEITSRLHTKGYSCGTIVSMSIVQFTATGNAYKVTLTDNAGKTLTFTKGDSIRSALGANSIRFTIAGSSASNGIYVNSGDSTLSGGLSSAYAVGESGVAAALGLSSAYAITGSGETVAVDGSAVQTATGSFVLKGTGRGHNVGMSQWGAYSMAKYHNMTYNQILKFYFTGVTVE